jgi:hypothetical protein
VSRFSTVPRLSFERRRAEESRDTAPAAARARALVRRTAMLAEARQALAVLPAPGEAVHTLMTGYYDLMHVVALILDKRPADHVRLSTLCDNRRNLDEIVSILDGGVSARVSLLASCFFRDHNKALWGETVCAFRRRGQRLACARNHCKVVTVRFKGGGLLVLEGSANLRTNRNREQLTLINDPFVCDFHDRWFDAALADHEGEIDAAEEG